MKISEQFSTDWHFAYFGVSLLKIASIPLIKSFSLRTLAFSASLVSAGTFFGRKKGAEIFQIDFDQASENYKEFFIKVALLIGSATGALLLSQCHRFNSSLPNFTHLGWQDCFILGMAQGLSVSIPLLWETDVYEEIPDCLDKETFTP